MSPYGAIFKNNNYVVPEDKFIPWLLEFLSTDGKCHRSDIVFDSSNQTIIVSRIMAYAAGLNNATDYMRSITQTEKAANSTLLTAFVIF